MASNTNSSGSKINNKWDLLKLKSFHKERTLSTEQNDYSLQTEKSSFSRLGPTLVIVQVICFRLSKCPIKTTAHKLIAASNIQLLLNLNLPQVQATGCFYLKTNNCNCEFL